MCRPHQLLRDTRLSIKVLLFTFATKFDLLIAIASDHGPSLTILSRVRESSIRVKSVGSVLCCDNSLSRGKRDRV